LPEWAARAPVLGPYGGTIVCDSGIQAWVCGVEGIREVCETILGVCLGERA
jgi:hypothetical protein